MMVDIQRAAAFASTPALYHASSGDVSSDTDSESLYEATHPSPSSSAAPSSNDVSSFAFASMRHSVLEGAQAAEDDDNLFAYAEDAPDLPLRANSWEYGAGTAFSPQVSTPSAVTSPASSSKTSDCASPRLSMVASASRLPGNALPTVKQGIKRPLASADGAAIVSSMLALNQPSIRRTPTTMTTGRRAIRKDEAALPDLKPSLHPPVKKAKVSRERQLKINAASRRCRKKQKLELQFLRTHVIELQLALKEQVDVMLAVPAQEQRVARLATLLEQSARQVEEMSAGGRPGATIKPAVLSEADLEELRSVAAKAQAQAQLQAQQHPESAPSAWSPRSSEVTAITTPRNSGSDDLPAGHDHVLSAERKATLLHIASFIRNNMALESQSFSPEVISCLPIEMDGWQLRLAITEKNYTIHNSKFFPCDVHDMFAFCWETNVTTKTSVKQGADEYCVVTPLATDVAYVNSKTIGKWSLSVHGVPNVSYNSLLCRMHDAEHNRAIICQQSVLEDSDFEDESTIPWLFKRWVVFQPRVVDGVRGTVVEAYRTASYATGRLIYKENNTYDSFCEHLIRRYAESNSLLERMLARDPRFQHVAAIDPSNATAAAMEQEETTSDLLVKDLLLF